MSGRNRSFAKLLTGSVVGSGLLVVVVIIFTLAFTSTSDKITSSATQLALVSPSSYPNDPTSTSENVAPTPESYSATTSPTKLTYTATAISSTTKSTLAIEVVTGTPSLLTTPTPASPTYTRDAATSVRPGSIISPGVNQKLTPDEKAGLNILKTDLQNLNASIERVNQLRLQVYPDQQAWLEKLQKEVKYWQDLLMRYKAAHFSSRLETQVLPDWLAALAWLDRGGQLLVTGHRVADGIKVSQGDQQVAFAGVALAKVNEIIVMLNKL